MTTAAQAKRDKHFLHAIRHHDQDEAVRTASNASHEALWEGANIAVAHHMTPLFLNLMNHLDWNDQEKVHTLWKHVVWNSHQDICDAMWDAHPPTEPINFNFSLTSYVEQGNVEMMKRFVPWMDTKPEGLNESIFEAIYGGYVEILSLLIDHHQPKTPELYLEAAIRSQAPNGDEAVRLLAPLCSDDDIERILNNFREHQNDLGYMCLKSIHDNKTLTQALDDITHHSSRTPKI